MKRPNSRPPPSVPSAALAAIMQAIAASLDVARIFSIIAEQAGHVLAHEALVVLLAPSASDAAADGALAVAFAHPPAVGAGQAWPLRQFSFGSALRAQQPVVVADFAATAAAHAGDQMLLDAGGHAAVMVPILAASRVLGGLVLLSRTAGAYRRPTRSWSSRSPACSRLALEHQRLDAAGQRPGRGRGAQPPGARNPRHPGAVAHRHHYQSRIPQTVCGRAEPGPTRRCWPRPRPWRAGRLEEARRSVLGLHPTPLQHQSLRAALTAELAGLAKRAGLVTQFYCRGRGTAAGAGAGDGAVSRGPGGVSEYLQACGGPPCPPGPGLRSRMGSCSPSKTTASAFGAGRRPADPCGRLRPAEHGRARAQPGRRPGRHQPSRARDDRAGDPAVWPAGPRPRGRRAARRPAGGAGPRAPQSAC